MENAVASNNNLDFCLNCFTKKQHSAIVRLNTNVVQNINHTVYFASFKFNVNHYRF